VFESRQGNKFELRARGKLELREGNKFEPGEGMSPEKNLFQLGGLEDYTRYGRWNYLLETLNKAGSQRPGGKVCIPSGISSLHSLVFRGLVKPLGGVFRGLFSVPPCQSRAPSQLKAAPGVEEPRGPGLRPSPVTKVAGKTGLNGVSVKNLLSDSGRGGILAASHECYPALTAGS